VILLRVIAMARGRLARGVVVPARAGGVTRNGSVFVMFECG
jgi:hypothetical protein